MSDKDLSPPGTDDQTSVDVTSPLPPSVAAWEWTANSLVRPSDGKMMLWSTADAVPCGRAGDYYECHNQRSPAAILRVHHDARALIATAPALFNLADALADMSTEEEFGEDGMSGDDAVDTLSSLIVWARRLRAQATGGAA